MAKLLNQGVYGCVYYPSFTCRGNISKSKNLVTKLELKDNNSVNEIDIGNIIKKIRNYDKYFAPIIRSCDIKLNVLTDKDSNKGSLDECNVVKNSEYAQNDFKLIYIKHINGQDIDKYMKNIEVPTLFISTIFSVYFYCLKGLDLLGGAGVIHFDLHSGNIFYDLDNQRPMIIDFGLSIDVSKFIKRGKSDSGKSDSGKSDREKSNREEVLDSSEIEYYKLKRSLLGYKPKHYNYTPEAHFLSYLLDKYHGEKDDLSIRLTNDSLIIFLNDIINYNKILPSYNQISSVMGKKEGIGEKYKKQLMLYYSRFLDKDYKTIIDDICQYYVIMDDYMLNINFIKFIIDKFIVLSFSENDSGVSGTRNENIYNKILYLLLQIWVLQLHPVPDKRLTRGEIILLFKAIISGNESGIFNIVREKARDFIDIDDIFSMIHEPKFKEFLGSIQKDIHF